jgi:hypothetical protein
VLGAVVDWSKLHQQEIVMLSISFGNKYGSDPRLLKSICSQTLGTAVAAGTVLQPCMVPRLFKVPWPYDMFMNEIWALSGHPRIITNWADCTGESWSPPDLPLPLPFATHYVDYCPDPQGMHESAEHRTADDGLSPYGGARRPGLGEMGG